MKKQKLSIDQLKVKSFVTTDEQIDLNTLKGGDTIGISNCRPVPEYENTKRIVMGACWYSEATGPGF